jgi:hypothetical protein
MNPKNIEMRAILLATLLLMHCFCALPASQSALKVSSQSAFKLKGPVSRELLSRDDIQFDEVEDTESWKTLVSHGPINFPPDSIGGFDLSLFFIAEKGLIAK